VDSSETVGDGKVGFGGRELRGASYYVDVLAVLNSLDI
jgi:hypothetical protein